MNKTQTSTNRTGEEYDTPFALTLLPDFLAFLCMYATIALIVLMIAIMSDPYAAVPKWYFTTATKDHCRVVLPTC